MNLFDLVPPNSDDPAWLAAPQTPLEQRFKAFHEANPQIYRELETRAMREHERGSKRLSIAKLAEQLREDYAVTSVADSYKINNSWRAFYARLLMHRHPAMDGKFELREQRKDREQSRAKEEAAHA